MKPRDPIVEELHRLRERIARAHGFDVDSIAAKIRTHEAARTSRTAGRTSNRSVWAGAHIMKRLKPKDLSKIKVVASSGNVFADIGIRNPEKALADAQRASRLREAANKRAKTKSRPIASRRNKPSR